MDLTPRTRLADLLSRWPFLKDFLVAYNPRYKLLESRTMRATVGRMATLQMVASMGSVDVATLLRDLQAEVRRQTGDEPPVLEAGGEGRTEEELATLKAMIRRLHQGEPLERLNEEYAPVLERLDPLRIADLEQQLLAEGLPAEEVQQLCGIHLDLFRRTLDRTERPDAPSGHPVHTYMAENRAIEGLVERWDQGLAQVASGTAPADLDLHPVLAGLFRVETHYQRKENQLFPYLERKGFTGPSSVMWGVHDEVRNLLRQARIALEAGDREALLRRGTELSRGLLQMIYMEERILLPTALGMLDEADWRAIREGDDQIGYAFVTPGNAWPEEVPPEAAPAGAVEPGSGEALALSTGALTAEQVDLLLRHLPVEASFVDEEDRVRYYTDVPHRVFPRSPGVVGRRVQNCHPQSSVGVVQQILDAFRSGREDRARFWITLRGRFILIEYVAIRDAAGAYRGCLEVTQDVTGIRALEGERRLLQWEAGG